LEVLFLIVEKTEFAQSFFANSPFSHTSTPLTDCQVPPVDAHTVRAKARRSLTRSSAVVTLKKAAATAAATTVPNAIRVMLIFMWVLLTVAQRKLRLRSM
jgi:hypothetical protein